MPISYCSNTTSASKMMCPVSTRLSVEDLCPIHIKNGSPKNGNWRYARFQQDGEEQYLLNSAVVNRLLSAKWGRQDINIKMALPLRRTKKNDRSVPLGFYPPETGRTSCTGKNYGTATSGCGEDCITNQVSSSSAPIRHLSTNTDPHG